MSNRIRHCIRRIRRPTRKGEFADRPEKANTPTRKGECAERKGEFADRPEKANVRHRSFTSTTDSVEPTPPFLNPFSYSIY
jgi:hypothetical protein